MRPRDEPPRIGSPWPWERPRRRWPIVVAIVLASAVAVFGSIVMAGFIALGIGIESGRIPDTKAVPGEKLPVTSLLFLRDRELLAADETVIYFYSGGFLDIESDGSFFTDRRVVRYEEDPFDGDFCSWTAEYPAIASIEPEFDQGLLTDSSIRVRKVDGSEFALSVASEGGGDRTFAKRLLEEWEKRRSVPIVEEAK